MSWCRAILHNTPVFARCNEAGELLISNGRVEIRYRTDDGRAYHALAKNVVIIENESILPDDTCSQKVLTTQTRRSRRTKITQKIPIKQIELPKGVIAVYTDGACSGNPGPAGLGIIVKDGEQSYETSQYIGQATNNIAELTAIRNAFITIEDKNRPVRLYTDSRYSIGVLSEGWKAKANQELILEIISLMDDFTDVKLIYLPGHKGHPLNERADRLAREAIKEKKGLSCESV